MPLSDENGSKNTACVYEENGRNIEDLIAESFAIFALKEAAQSYIEANGQTLIGGAPCTHQ